MAPKPRKPRAKPTVHIGAHVVFQASFPDANRRMTDSDTRVDALLKMVSTCPGVSSVVYQKGMYMVEQNELFDLAEGIVCKVVNKMKIGSDEIERIYITLTSSVLSVQDIIRFVDETDRLYQLEVQNKLGDRLYVFEQCSKLQVPRRFSGQRMIGGPAAPWVTFTKNEFVSNRSFDNVFLDDHLRVKKRVDFFINHRKWYDRKGIPWTLGLLMSGPAGTGKTSLLKALVNATKRHIVNISLQSITGKTQLRRLFFDETLHVVDPNEQSVGHEPYRIPNEKRIYVIEDVDCATDLVLDREFQKPVAEAPQSRKKDGDKKQESALTSTIFGDMEETDEDEQDDDKLTLAALLNVLDGTLETPGRILVLTTNYPEKLDKALIRKGRIDLSLQFKLASKDIVAEMYESFFEKPVEDKFRGMLPDRVLTPAEVSAVLFENFDDPDKGLQDLVHVAA